MQTFKKFLRWTLPLMIVSCLVWLLMFLFSLITWHVVLICISAMFLFVGLIYLLVWTYIK